ncbi:hypothetical protein [Gluconacetobacter takamatsuzukensis]|uniref:Uncharacterized protein n=1 Tax=Gluconacetobacter takamatsuzukensis TaxID=1286190 RepID=A0A7W4KFQ0_9PROT|nr:hypothetical protein [Gluconacetobacter takamatsuzukensis]MBB2206083.1 hypothetical protein [Gluconacetobacter takamatsuzukensis]
MSRPFPMRGVPAHDPAIVGRDTESHGKKRILSKFEKSHKKTGQKINYFLILPPAPDKPPSPYGRGHAQAIACSVWHIHDGYADLSDPSLVFYRRINRIRSGHSEIPRQPGQISRASIVRATPYDISMTAYFPSSMILKKSFFRL